MKRIKFLSGLLTAMFFSSLLLSSCSKQNSNNTVNPSVITGNWSITLYYDNTDETAHYNGYSFNFNSNGQLAATKGSNTVTGSWSLSSSKLIINFGTDVLLGELNNDWLIEENTAGSIKLKDDNPAQNDKLQFIKL